MLDQLSNLGVIALTPVSISQNQNGNTAAGNPSERAHTLTSAPRFVNHLPIAARRKGQTGVLSLEMTDLGEETIRQNVLVSLRELMMVTEGRAGIKYGAEQRQLAEALLDVLSAQPGNIVIIVPDTESEADLAKAVQDAQKRGLEAFVEATSKKEAQLAEKVRADAVIAKGHEAGGRIGENTTFVLLQECLRQVKIPVWAQGGIGTSSAAACLAAGARGVVLDSQLLLTRESDLTLELKHKFATMDGTETTTVGIAGGVKYRFVARSGHPLIEFAERHKNSLTELELKVEIARCCGRQDPVHIVGQDIAFAHDLGSRFVTVAGVIDALRESARANVMAANQLQILKENAPLARSHNTRYPIVQGAMTRVSDTADFAVKVAAGGALPFLALALMRAQEVDALLRETAAKIGTASWGVGILGFVPAELRQE
ncbi:MAG TPA: nitronate monooxygenase, partial [Candidatus Obscuribacterales bacterium]